MINYSVVMAKRNGKLVYPVGVRGITKGISTDELVRRLKDCAKAFEYMNQTYNDTTYIPLALHLASEFFLKHHSEDVRLLVACCIADVFRVFAPKAPYEDFTQLKTIFEFFVQQLNGLKDTKSPNYRYYFYLLEHFSCVKTFNICFELEDNQEIFMNLFKQMFEIINYCHSNRVQQFMLEMLSSVINEADDFVLQELLDIILIQIVEPNKSQSKCACSLAQDILKRTTSSIAPTVQNFFIETLMHRETGQNEMKAHVYELIYELNLICPSVLTVVLPQLEFKLKSTDEKERLDVIGVLAHMFSDEKSTMIECYRTLWSCFLARFNDISAKVRVKCVKSCKNFLLHHPEAKNDITEQLKQRHIDFDETVRYQVVWTILSTARIALSCVNEELLGFVKERTLDIKFEIRKASLLGLAILYKEYSWDPEINQTAFESLAWIRNRVLHIYYKTALKDRLLVEKVLKTCIVPYEKPMKERMKLLYQLFCSVDDYAVKAFKEIMKIQYQLRAQVESILDVIQCEKSENRKKTIATAVAILCKHLQDPAKSYTEILKFCNEIEYNLMLRTWMTHLYNDNISSSEAKAKVKEILKTLGKPIHSNVHYVIIKQLLERTAPLMVDKEGIDLLVGYVQDALLGKREIEAELGLTKSAQRGLELLWVLSCVFPTAFHDERIYNNLIQILCIEDVDDAWADLTLQIFMNISNKMEINFPEISSNLVLVLETFVETGTSKQAKHAVYCIYSIVSDKEKVFGNIIDNLKKHFTLQSQYFRTALCSVGHIAYLCHDMFAADFKNIIAKIVVKDLLMLDQVTKDFPQGGDDSWGPFDFLPDETKIKIEGMKVMARWLLGLKTLVQPAISTLRLLATVILHEGDLMKKQHNSPLENSWMRISAAACMLKLCQEPNYVNVISLEHFQVLAFILNDKCPEVKDRFAQKVHKGLFTLKLPLQFLAVFTLAALDDRKEFRAQIKNYIVVNINKRKECMEQQTLSNGKLCALMPDYSLAYAVHLLAHCPIFKTYNDVLALLKIKECLWMLMEPLMVKNEDYSYSFLKRLLENIKQTKDKQAPNDKNANLKMYAVCDVALSIIENNQFCPKKPSC